MRGRERGKRRQTQRRESWGRGERAWRFSGRRERGEKLRLREKRQNEDTTKGQSEKNNE